MRKLLHNKRGNAAVILTAVMPMMIGAGALAIDVGSWALDKRKLQRMADSAALAGALAVQQTFQPREAVAWDLRNNQLVPILPSPVIENAPLVGKYVGDKTAVRVVVKTTPRLPFVSYLMTGPTTLTAEATAMATPDPRYCMVALDPQPAPALEFAGDANVNLDCGIMTNSKSKQSAVRFGGSSARVKATTVGAVGKLAAGINWVSPTQLNSNQAPLADPFAAVPEAVTFIPTNCSSKPLEVKNQNANISPGCWRGGMIIDGSVTMAPGVYVIDSGDFSVGSGARIIGDGVTIILTTSSGDSNKIGSMYTTGNSEIRLTAPSTGELKDLIVYQDRRAKGTTSTATGNSTSKFAGTLYFPSTTLSFTGNSTLDANCLRMVASKLAFSGSSSATTNCTSQADRLFGMKVRLVA